jgi:adenylate kinase
MRVLLVGAPGAGKGTQAKLLAAHFDVPHISSGVLLREHMARGTDEGREAAALVEAGDLVPDELVKAVLREPVQRAKHQGGFILDGFPRTLRQAQHAQLEPEGSDFAVEAVVHLEVAQDELVRRLLARARGADDDGDVIAHRLEVFEEHIRPMLKFFEERGELVTVAGDRPVGDVSGSIVQHLEGLNT